VQRLRDEAESLRQQLEVAKAPRNLLTPDLEAVRDRILSGLKVGKQSSEYKRTKAAIDSFISEVLEQ
jgi:hypothetical protein